MYCIVTPAVYKLFCFEYFYEAYSFHISGLGLSSKIHETLWCTGVFVTVSNVNKLLTCDKQFVIPGKLYRKKYYLKSISINVLNAGRFHEIHG